MTSEPVGNTPRGSSIPNNSHKARAERTPEVSEEPREELKQIVTGKVMTRKTPWYRKIARSLIADDATSVGDYIVSDVVVPALRNLIFDMISGGASRTLYGSGRAIRRDGTRISGGGPVSSLRTRYDQMAEEPSRRLSREQRARHDFRDVVLVDREEAMSVLETMMDYADRFGVVTVADFYTLVGVTGDYAARSWGWSTGDIANADIRQFRGGWLIDLPEAKPIRP